MHARSSANSRPGLAGRFTRMCLEIGLYRHGWALPAALLLALLCYGLVYWQLLPRSEAVNSLRAEWASTALIHGRLAAPATAALGADTSAALLAVLRGAEPVPSQMRRVSALADSLGITLPKGQYGEVKGADGALQQTEAVLSFVTDYPRARKFTEALLLDFPQLSIDRFSIEREQVQGSQARVHLHISLWRWADGPAKESSMPEKQP